MNLKEQNILMITRATQLGGAETVALQMCKALLPYVNKIVICGGRGIKDYGFEKLNIKKYYISDIANKSPQNIIENLTTIRKILINERITIVHTHHRTAALYSVILSKFYEIKCIYSVHGFFYDKKILTRYIYKNVRIVACGDLVKQNIVDVYKVDQKKIEVIHNAINYVAANQEGELVLTELKNKKKRLIGYIGRLSPEKGVKYFIETFSFLCKEYSDVIYVIVGNGPEEHYLKEMVKEKGWQERIIFLGYKTNVIEIIRQLEFIVLCSLTEGLPLTPIEAFSVKKTIVATDVGGTREIVVDNYNGFLVKPRDIGALSNKIKMLLDNEDLKKTFESNAYRTYKEKFSFNVFKEKTINLYESFQK